MTLKDSTVTGTV